VSVYLFRRLFQAIPTLFGITLISFMLMLATPGDPVSLLTFRDANTSPEDEARLRRQLGLDQPAMTQYLYWLVGNDWTTIDVDGDGQGDVNGIRRGVLRADFGQSIMQRRPVFDLLMERIPATLQLTLTALVVGYAIGIPLGVLAAVYHRSWFDQFSRLISVIGNAVPSFWLALILMIIFGVMLNWLPISGMRDLNNPNATFLENLRYMILPVTVLSLGTIASISRFLRAKMLEVLGQDYMRTAQSKGLSEPRVWWGHGLRNALLPVATFIGPQVGFLLGGAVIIETIFSWPGMGRLVVNAMFERDYPLIMGSVVMSAILYIIGLIISDILYAVIDPRIRLS
jgi:peptide/nickel transport system permease protein